MRYFEKRFDGSRTFELVGTRVRIKGSLSLRSEFDITVELAAVSDAYAIMRVRHRMFFIALIVLAGLVFSGVFIDEWIVLSGGIVVALVLMALTFRKQTFYQFHYLNGGVAFDVCEAGPEKTRAIEFVNAVVAAIPPSAPPPTSGPPPVESESRR